MHAGCAKAKAKQHIESVAFVAESIVPTPKDAGVRTLTEGSASIRHPLMRPSAWQGMLADRSGRGRLLRAMAFDPPALGQFARELPVSALRFARACARLRTWTVKQTDCVFEGD